MSSSFLFLLFKKHWVFYLVCLQENCKVLYDAPKCFLKTYPPMDEGGMTGGGSVILLTYFSTIFKFF
jgi:hypothetical protein